MKNLIELLDSEKQEHEEKYGGYNSFPPGWREITEEEFAGSQFFRYEAVMREYRQMYPKGKVLQVLSVDAALYWMHDGTGYSIVSEYNTVTGKYSLKFFTFGCDHTWGGEFTPEERANLPHGRCMHSQKCSKCDYIESYDSSD